MIKNLAVHLFDNRYPNLVILLNVYPLSYITYSQSTCLSLLYFLVDFSIILRSPLASRQLTTPNYSKELNGNQLAP